MPTAKPVTQYYQDEEVRERDRQKKEIMKVYADRKQYVKEHDVCVDDIVLVPHAGQLICPWRVAN